MSQRHCCSLICLHHSSLPIKTQVAVLYHLCEWRLADAPDVGPGSVAGAALQDLAPATLRLEPCGHDKSGNTYWYITGTRLYREGTDTSPVPQALIPCKDQRQCSESRKERKSLRNRSWCFRVIAKCQQLLRAESAVFGSWEICCSTGPEWREFIETLESTKNQDQLDLVETLKAYLPDISEIWRKKVCRGTLIEFQHFLTPQSRPKSPVLDMSLLNWEPRNSSRQQVLRERQLEIDKQVGDLCVRDCAMTAY